MKKRLLLFLRRYVVYPGEVIPHGLSFTLNMTHRTPLVTMDRRP